MGNEHGRIRQRRRTLRAYSRKLEIEKRLIGIIKMRLRMGRTGDNGRSVIKIRRNPCVIMRLDPMDWIRGNVTYPKECKNRVREENHPAGKHSP